MFSRQQQTATKVPQGNRWVGSTNGWSHGSNGWYWPTHPWISFLFVLTFFPFANRSPKKSHDKLFHKTVWFKSNPFSANFYMIQIQPFSSHFVYKLIYIIQNRILKKKTFCGFCVSKTLPIFRPPFSSTKTEDQIEVCESSSQLIRAGLIQCHGDTLTTLPSCNDFRVFQGSLLGHRAGKKDKTKGTWKQSHFFKMNLRT